MLILKGLVKLSGFKVSLNVNLLIKYRLFSKINLYLMKLAAKLVLVKAKQLNIKRNLQYKIQ